jgi:hypothetical protein
MILTADTGAYSNRRVLPFQASGRSQKLSLAKSAAGVLPQFAPPTVSHSFAAAPVPSIFAS